MDDPRHPPEAAGLPGQGPHRDTVEFGPESVPFTPLRLVLRPGGSAVDVTRPDVLIGRHSDADIRLVLPDVSRRHCRLVFGNRRWQVFDLNSLNGLYVNGSRVQQATLHHGDQLRIGGLTFAVVMPGADAAPAEPARDREVTTRGEILDSIAKVLPLPPREPPQRKAS